MLDFDFFNPVRIIFGPGKRKLIGLECKKKGFQKILLVCSKGPFRENGLYNEIYASLKEEGIQVFTIGDIDSNPRISSVREGAAVCKQNNIECIVALGGGSTMDCSKVIAAAAMTNNDPWEYLWGPRMTFKDSLPTILIPTIAATGTDINPTAVIMDQDAVSKNWCAAECMYPIITIADPEIHVSVPIKLTVWGIMDILSHTFEYYFNGYRGSMFQNRFSEAIIHTVIECTEKLINNPSNIEIRGELWWASVMAWGGLTKIGQEDPDMACHTIAEGFIPYFDIHHGATLGVVTPRWMRWAVQKRPEIFARFAEKIFGIGGSNQIEKAKQGIECYITWIKKIGAPLALQDLTKKEVSEDTLRSIAARIYDISDGNVGRLAKADENDILAILQKSCERL